MFRHLYVLASQPRCVEAVDVDSAQRVYVPLSITVTTPGAAVQAVQKANGAAAGGAGTAREAGGATAGENEDGGAEDMAVDGGPEGVGRGGRGSAERGRAAGGAMRGILQVRLLNRLKGSGRVRTIP